MMNDKYKNEMIDVNEYLIIKKVLLIDESKFYECSKHLTIFKCKSNLQLRYNKRID